MTLTFGSGNVAPQSCSDACHINPKLSLRNIPRSELAQNKPNVDFFDNTELISFLNISSKFFGFFGFFFFAFDFHQVDFHGQLHWRFNN